MPSRSEGVLKELIATEGIHEAVVVGRDGFVIEHDGDMDAEGIGAIISTSIGAVESLGRDAGQGGLFELMAEFRDGVVIVAPIGRDAVLGTVAKADANLGRIRHAVKKALPELERTL